MTDDELIAEVRTVFGGVVPNVVARILEAGELEQRWPAIRSILVEPAPLPPAVVEAMLLVLTLRCRHAYCFVMHSLGLLRHEATPVAIEQLARMFEMPAVVPEHERWTRNLKLAWLSRREGPQRGAADLRLRGSCSEAEYARLIAVCEVGELLNRYVAVGNVTLDDEPALAELPAELRELVPVFIQFHTQLNRTDARRPVAAACSVCRDVRSTDDEWYPFETARELLSDDVLFSHGLCPKCYTPDAGND